MFSLALISAVRKSPTFDEQGFITRGLAYLRGQNRHMRIGHPLGLNALNAALLLPDGSVELPLDDPSWLQTSFHRPSELFLWEIGNDAEHVMFLARLPTIWLGLLLAALAGRWAWAITRNRWAGLAAVILVAFDPNILAHTRLATTDLGLAAGALLAGYTLWRFLKHPSWGAAVLAGIAFGLLQDTKFTAALFAPLFAAVIIVALLPLRGTADEATGSAQRVRMTPLPRSALAKLLIAYPLSAFLALWALYGFQVGTLPQGLPTFSQLAGQTLPLSHHLEQLLDIGGRLQKTTPAFLLGQYSDSGWVYYFPIAFLLKSPVPSLVLLLWATVSTVRNRGLALMPRGFGGRRLDLAALLIPGIGYFVISMTGEINLGYRHIMPVLPFLYVFSAVALVPKRAGLTFSLASFPSPFSRPRLSLLPHSLALLLLWLVASVLILHPHFLAYFNLFAGGPEDGWRALVDSNLDWGQDLGALKAWTTENSVDHIWLSYFGEARPDYYGINYTGLDSYPPRLMNPEARPFYPFDPAPGIYAISATNLQGVLFDDHDQFAWFRDRRPLAKIGYSIFVFEVSPRGTPAHIMLSSVQLDEIEASDYALLDTNQVTPHWFDPAESLLIPPGDNVWWALSHQAKSNPIWISYMESSFRPAVVSTGYTLYKRVKALQPVDIFGSPTSPIARFRNGSGQIMLTGVISVTKAAEPGGEIRLLTTWKQQASPQPVKIFVHAISSDGEIATQWDGLGAAWEGWREEDVLVQTHRLPLSGDVPISTYQVSVGLYHPESGLRWHTSSTDRVDVSEVVVRRGE